MWYSIHVADKPKKFVEKMFPDYKKSIKECLEGLSTNPYPRGCIPLEGRHNCYRIWIGPFRIQYVISEQDKVVVIFKISRRDETTYK